VSPVAASMYCSPQPAALHIDPPPGSGCFAFMIPRPENCLTDTQGGWASWPKTYIPYPHFDLHCQSCILACLLAKRDGRAKKNF
jgi:hypothetical protein